MPDMNAWAQAVVDGCTDAAPAVAETLREAADTCFATSTDPWGQPWAGLAESTLIARARRLAGPSRTRNRTIGPLPEGVQRFTRRRGYDTRLAHAAISVMTPGNVKPLIDHGTLRGSVFGEPTGRQAGVTDATIGAGGPAAAYAMHQQFGDEDDYPLVARPFLPIRPDGTVDLPAALDIEVQATIRDAIDARMRVAMQQDIAAEE
jgi:phage gpG-like protein